MNESKSHLRRRRVITTGLGALVCGLAMAGGAAFAQAYPSRPITIVVPYPPGGALDALARMTGQRLSQKVGQMVLVENRAGASGTLGTRSVAQAPADGYTLLMGNSGPNAISQFVFAKLGYDPATSFAPVSVLVETPYYLTVPATSSIRSVADLVAIARANPRKDLSFGSSGIGGLSHLAGEMLNQAIGASFVHVPYKGTAPLTQAVLADEVQLAFMTGTDAGAHVKSGKLRLLASTTSTRSPELPTVPVLSDVGVAGVDIPVWYGLLAPAGTPEAVVGLLQKTMEEIIAEPEIRTRLEALNFVTKGSSPAEFSALIQADLARYGRAVKAAGLTAQ